MKPPGAVLIEGWNIDRNPGPARRDVWGTRHAVLIVTSRLPEGPQFGPVGIYNEYTTFVTEDDVIPPETFA